MYKSLPPKNQRLREAGTCALRSTSWSFPATYRWGTLQFWEGEQSSLTSAHFLLSWTTDGVLWLAPGSLCWRRQRSVCYGNSSCLAQSTIYAVVWSVVSSISEHFSRRRVREQCLSQRTCRRICSHHSEHLLDYRSSPHRKTLGRTPRVTLGDQAQQSFKWPSVYLWICSTFFGLTSRSSWGVRSPARRFDSRSSTSPARSHDITSSSLGLGFWAVYRRPSSCSLVDSMLSSNILCHFDRSGSDFRSNCLDRTRYCVYLSRRLQFWTASAFFFILMIAHARLSLYWRRWG